MSRHLVDPELTAMLDVFPGITLSTETIVAMRAQMGTMAMPRDTYARPHVTIEDRTVPGPDGAPDVPVTLYRPTDATGKVPVLLYLHGGGYVMGTAESSGAGAVRTADEVKCLVVSVDYRLAPETKAPGAAEDAHAVLAWLNKEAAALGIDTDRIAIGGDSAGGGLAAATALLARDKGLYKLCFQLLVYPMLDDRTAANGAQNPHVGDFIWQHDHNVFAWTAYLGAAPGGDDVSPYAAAARAKDLAGLPPAYISVGALDLFLEEDMAYAARLAAAGVPTELHVYPGAYHAFEFNAESDVSIRAEADKRRALKRAFAA
ncbi:alpha/beta hydrolase [Sphingobium nicotianae]|uniref:Alpha/beta hydrolase n=1 Tax=Sphingobium nicotianae TaxID=2782607 RepID=A0A9X1DAK5_9SPHN|nr:alpha/beta hydrolase [Sphingobium nicotianae]MBT2186446.1 alpha/beta hydrolase [Sphingobium nicotianae]